MPIEHDELNLPMLPEFNRQLQAQGYESLLFVTLKISDGKVGVAFTRPTQLGEQIEQMMLARNCLEKTVTELIKQWNKIKEN